jgi:hypothetical protein
MKKVHIKRAVIVLLFMMPLYMASQEKLKGNKIVVTENREISPFEKIVIKDKIDVEIIQGNETFVKVETDENIQFAVLTEVKGNTLTISLSHKITRRKLLKVYISVNDLINEISTSDRADITSNGILNFDRLTINAAGDSEITMNVKCSQFTLNNLESANLNLSVNTDEGIITTNKTGRAKINLKSEKMEIFSKGNSTTELTGTTTELIVHAENKSNLKAEGLESDEITVTASDNSDIHVNAKNSIIISAINSAEIYIYNKPKISIDKFIDKAILRKK